MSRKQHNVINPDNLCIVGDYGSGKPLSRRSLGSLGVMALRLRLRGFRV